MVVMTVPGGERRSHRSRSIGTWTRSVVTIGLITGLYFVLPLQLADLTRRQLAVRGPVFIAGMAVLTWMVARQVRRALERTHRVSDRIAVLATLVDVVVVFFAVLYDRMADQFHGVSTRLDALYFAVTTLTTVGYGDITATGQLARALVIVQMFFDLVVVTSAISIVVAALRDPQPERNEDHRSAARDGGR